MAPFGATGPSGGNGSATTQIIVTDGAATNLSATASASGGTGCDVCDGGTPGHGGNASSTAAAETNGSGNTSASASSTGGMGGGGFQSSESSDGATGSDGGTSMSFAVANANIGNATAQATATGGVGGVGEGFLNHGGNGNGATATAEAFSGSGVADALATASGGLGGSGYSGGAVVGMGGSATATAIANNIAVVQFGGPGANGAGGYACAQVQSGPSGTTISLGPSSGNGNDRTLLSSSGGNDNNGTLSVTSSTTCTASMDGITGTGTLTIGDGTHATTLQLAYDSGDSSQNGLSINAGSTLDVANNHMFINYGSGSDPITTIAGYIKSGFNNGAWNGPGIISTAALTPTNGLYYGVGYADGADGVVGGL